MKTKLIFSLLALQLSLGACSAPSSLTARIDSPTTAVRASLVASSAGQSLRVIQTDQLPDFLRSATEIRAVLDNSNSTYAVVRNADGSLSIPLTAGRQPDSQGLIEILLIDGSGRSALVRFDTGPLLKLAATPITVSPSAQVVVGTELNLQAQFSDAPDLSAYVFSWSAATALNGTFTPLSGTGPAIKWTPASAGNYYLRLEMRDTRTGAASTFTTSTPALYVASADQIVITDPADGRVLAGDKISLRANVGEFQGSNPAWLWSYSQSPVGPFQPISGQGSVISWEPPAAGSYYLRLQANTSNQQNTYTTSRPVVLVANADEVISVTPSSGVVTRGQTLNLNAQVPHAAADARYLWSYSTSPVGPFTAIAAEGAAISWQPDNVGEFYLRLRVLNPGTGEEKTYTSSKSLLSVRDSDDRFILTPSPANLIKGQSVLLALKDVPADRSINWYYAATAAGPFLAIPTAGQNARWSPPAAGTFYLRAEVTGSNVPKVTYTSASALVNVNEASGVIVASPEGSQSLGKPVHLSVHLPEARTDAKYNWSIGPSAVGPWSAVQSFDTETTGPEINAYPPTSGNYFVKVDVTTDSGVLSFVSPRALIFTSPSRDFFATSPTPANIGTQGAVTLTAGFQPPALTGYTYSWSSSFAPTGPFTALGASITPKFTWVAPGLVGNYYIKLDILAPNHRGISLISSDPLVFVGESQSGAAF